MLVAIVLYPGFTALDAVGPYEVLRMMPDTTVRFVSHQAGPVPADSGIFVLGATHTYSEVPKPDIVLVPGSTADTLTAMADGVLLQWLQEVHKTTTLTLSVCSGSAVLAAAGLLKGLQATTHWVAHPLLEQFGAIPQKQQRIVESGKCITAAGVSAGIDLGLMVAMKLHGKAVAEKIQLLIEYDPMPPTDAGHPTKAPEDVMRIARKEMLIAAQNKLNAVSIPKILWRKVIDKVRRSYPV